MFPIESILFFEEALANFVTRNAWGIITAFAIIIFNAGALYATVKTRPTKEEVIIIVEKYIKDHQYVCPLWKEGAYFKYADGKVLENDIKHIKTHLEKIEKMLNK
jgi:hypothetical protein